METFEFHGSKFELELPPFAFNPNVWTEVLLEGLQSMDLKDRKVLEIGFGSGIAAILLFRKKLKEYVGVDIDPRLIPVARANILFNCPDLEQPFRLLESDLYQDVGDSDFDLVYGCIPQVLKPPHVDLGEADSYARYFDPKLSPSLRNSYGLGLNERALIESKSVLKERGEILLVLSGRAGYQILEEMFHESGFTPEVVHEKSVAHLRATSLSTLVEQEKHGASFYFYSDPQCSHKITVEEAETRRLRGEDSYHKLYAVRGHS